MATCKDAVIDAVKRSGGIVSSQEVIDSIYRKYPDKPWKPISIKCHLIGLSVNHNSSKHYPTLHRQACLYYLGNGRYKLNDQNNDGINKEDSSGIVLNDDYKEATLSLERDLEEYIIRDLSQIEKDLKLYRENGITGREFNTEVGRIDILAVDKKGDFVVIELKAGTANYAVIGQILSYISWIRQNIAQGRNVRGIIIADDFDKRVKYASDELVSISLKKYEVSFKITNA